MNIIFLQVTSPANLLPQETEESAWLYDSHSSIQSNKNLLDASEMEDDCFLLLMSKGTVSNAVEGEGGKGEGDGRLYSSPSSPSYSTSVSFPVVNCLSNNQFNSTNFTTSLASNFNTLTNISFSVRY